MIRNHVLQMAAYSLMLDNPCNTSLVLSSHHTQPSADSLGRHSEKNYEFSSNHLPQDSELFQAGIGFNS